MTNSFQKQCDWCRLGGVLVRHRGTLRHPGIGRGETMPCADWDAEGRSIGEPVGFYVFAWLPVRCRNGKVRWLTWVERHDGGTYTLGNRAH